MKDTIKFKCWLAVMMTIAVIGILYILVYVPMPQPSKDAILLILGGLLSRLGDVYAFYFGSSEGSDKKTSLLAQAPPVQQP